jgi:hypothetical protein
MAGTTPGHDGVGGAGHPRLNGALNNKDVDGRDKPGHDGKQQLGRKPFTRRIKSRPVRLYFTVCLPGSPKVNAGGACGAWLPGRELLRISASTTASREWGSLLS